MSSFNIVEKVKYSKPQDGVVSVNEYILFKNDHTDEKYIIFKLYNQLNQRLHYVSYEVLQYDEENKLLEKTIFEYSDFNARAQECFVPKAKLKINPKCKDICCKLIRANFETIYWDNGNFVKVGETFNNYRDDKKTANGPEIKKPKNIKPHKQKKEKKKYYAKNITHRNIHKFPKTFTIILSVALIIFYIVSIILINQGDDLYYQGVAYKRINDEYIEVVGVDEDATSVEIVDKVNNLPVTRIVSGAFSGSNIESIVINAESIIIENNAFNDCFMLQDITANEIVSIGRNAFSGCASLGYLDLSGVLSVKSNAFANCIGLFSVNLPNATIESDAFIGCININTFIFGDTSCRYFGGMFGLENAEMFNSLQFITTNQSHITSYFYNNLYYINDFDMINPNVYVDDGALEQLNVSGYRVYDYYHVYKGTMVYLADGLSSLVINSNVNNIPAALLNQKGRYLRELEIRHSDVTLTAAHFSNCSYLESLTCDSSVVFETGALESVSSLKDLTIHCGDKPLYDIIGSNVVEKITATGSVPKNYFSNLYLNEVVLNTGTTVEDGAFNDVININKLTINLHNKTISDISNNQLNGLDELIVTGSTRMEKETFKGLNGLKRLTIEYGLTTYENGIFEDLVNLEYLNVQWDYSNYSHLANLFYSGVTDGSNLGQYVPKSLSTVVQNTVVDSMFYHDCVNINTLVFDNITYISVYLDSLTGLRNIYFSNYINYIDYQTISSLNSLAESHNINVYFEGYNNSYINNPSINIHEFADFSNFR